MAKKKEIPLNKVERLTEGGKRGLITAIASGLAVIALEFLGLELSAASMTAIATGIVTGIWKLLRSKTYTKKA